MLYRDSDTIKLQQRRKLRRGKTKWYETQKILNNQKRDANEDAFSYTKPSDRQEQLRTLHRNTINLADQKKRFVKNDKYSDFDKKGNKRTWELLPSGSLVDESDIVASKWEGEKTKKGLGAMHPIRYMRQTALVKTGALSSPKLAWRTKAYCKYCGSRLSKEQFANLENRAERTKIVNEKLKARRNTRMKAGKNDAYQKGNNDGRFQGVAEAYMIQGFSPEQANELAMNHMIVQRSQNINKAGGYSLNTFKNSSFEETDATANDVASVERHMAKTTKRQKRASTRISQILRNGPSMKAKDPKSNDAYFSAEFPQFDLKTGLLRNPQKKNSSQIKPIDPTSSQSFSGNEDDWYEDE